jgi:hypothetical protein
MAANEPAFQPSVAAALSLALILIPVFVLRSEGSPADLMALAVDGAIIVGAIVYMATNRHDKAYRWAVGLALAATFILFWMIGAVALLGPELGRNTADLIYFGLPAVGVLGAIIARFQPRGMARAMFATAGAVMVLPVVVVAGLTPLSPNQAGELFPYGLLLFHAPFAALFIGSGWLFRKSARARPTPPSASASLEPRRSG